MTTTVAGVAAPTNTPPATTTSPTVADPDSGSTAASSTSGLNQLDNTQTFLQLLVAQLKNQDPTNPADPTQFMTEIAQMTAVQSQTSLDAEEQTVAADSMIGKVVTGLTTAGVAASGLVNGVLLSSSGAPQLEIGAGADASTVPLTSISQVTAAYGSSSGTSPSAS